MNILYIYLGIAVILFIFIIWFVGRLIIRTTMVKDHTCPKCGNRYWDRIHRNFFEKFLTAGTKIRRYRCDNPSCHFEGYRISRRYTMNKKQQG
jgi:predicted RNA-binding Zn-ribbon protein involved in translation (DUF1610 family)